MQDFYTEIDDFIRIFKFVRSTDEAVLQWANALEQHIQDHATSEPFYALLDVTGDEVDFSAAARSNSKRIFNTYRKHSGYIAFLFEWRTSPYFARLFFASLGKLNFKLKYFTDEQDARQWLQAMYDEQEI